MLVKSQRKKPLLEKRSKTNLSNYGPISLLPLLSKVFDDGTLTGMILIDFEKAFDRLTMTYF